MHGIKMRELKVLLEDHDSIFKRNVISKKNGVRKHLSQKSRPDRRPRLNKEEKRELEETQETIIKEIPKNDDGKLTWRRFTRATIKESPGPFEFIELKSPRRKRKKRIQLSSAMGIKLEVKKEVIKDEQEDEGDNDGAPSPAKRIQRGLKKIDSVDAKKTVIKREHDFETDSHEDDSVASEDSLVDVSQSHDLVSEEYHIVDDESSGVVANNESDHNLVDNKTVYRPSKQNDTVIPKHLNNDLDSTEEVAEAITAENNLFGGPKEQKNTEMFAIAKEQDFVNNNNTNHPVYANKPDKLQNFSRKRKIDCLEIDDSQRTGKMRCLEEVVSEIFDKKIPAFEKRVFTQSKKEFEALKNETLQRELKNEAKLNQLEALLKTAVNNSQEVGKFLEKLAIEKEKKDQASQTEDLENQNKTEDKTTIDQAIQTEEAKKPREPEPKQVIDQATQMEEQVQTPQNPLKNDEVERPKAMEKQENSEKMKSTQKPKQNEKTTEFDRLKSVQKPKKNSNISKDDTEPKQIDRSKEEEERKENMIIGLQDEAPSSTKDLSLMIVIDSTGTPSDHHNSIFDRLGDKTDEFNNASPNCSPSNRSILSVSPENPTPPALTPIELQREMIERELKACNIIVTGFRQSYKIIEKDLDRFFRKKMKINPNITKVEVLGNSLLVTVDSPSVKEEIMKKKGILKRSTIFLKADYTGRERKVQAWLKGEAQRRSRNGRNIKVSYQKIKIDGVWWYWNDLEGRLNRRLFRPELIMM